MYYIVRCTGCSRQIGVSEAPSPLRNKVFCTGQCLSEPLVGTNETRDAVITELSRYNRSDSYIANLFGVGRSRVQQIASARRAG